MDKTVRSWIVEILESRRSVITIAVRQRAKFEGWLKFELAAHAEKSGASNVEVEASKESTQAHERSDITLYLQGVRYDLELKTPNTNWRSAGIETKTRPITKNIAGIVQDVKKLRDSVGQGIVAFVLFPIPPRDDRWTDYLRRIAADTGVPLSERHHCSRVSVSLEGEASADLIVCCFPVPRHVLPAS
ncbi:MAG: hypothetical protein WCD04_15975 [Terriglobia bacterium]|jgi:hypothetical protein